jgi:hypothetical protein
MLGSPQRRFVALALLVGACVDFGGSSSSSTTTADGTTTTVSVTSPRALDEICAQNHYLLEGDARREAGLTPDSCGFDLGPGAALVFPVLDWQEIVGISDGAELEIKALVVDLDGGAHDAHWIHGNLVEGKDLPDQPSPTNAVRVSSGNQHLGLVDVQAKITYTITDDYGGCSVAHRRITLRR